MYQWLLKTPVNITGAELDVHARALLVIPFVQIFGIDFVTPTINKLLSILDILSTERERMECLVASHCH